MPTRPLSIVLFAAVLCAGSTLLHGQQGRVTVLDGARILDGNGGTPIENGALLVQDGRVTAVGRSRRDSARRGGTRGRRRQDHHAGADQRPRPHRLRGLHDLGRAQSHASEPARSPAARSLLRRRGRHLGGQQPDGDVAPVSARSAGRQVPAGRALPVHARYGASARRPRSHPARGNRCAARGQRSDDAGRGARRDPEDGGLRRSAT